MPRLLFIISPLLFVTVGDAQQSDLATARRIADMAAVALDEYRHGVPGSFRDFGESWEELGEARAFLEEARQKTADLSMPLRAITLPVLDRLAQGVRDRRKPALLESTLDSLRQRLERVLKAPMDPLPVTPPSLARGAKLYRLRCAECHGKEGRGDGPKAHRMDPAPANFTLRDSLRFASPLDFFRKINVGVTGTEMRDWEGLISLDDRWALALYATSLRYRNSERAEGERILRERCAECLARVADFKETAGASDDSLSKLLARRLGSSSRDSTLVPLVAFARTAASVPAGKISILK